MLAVQGPRSAEVLDRLDLPSEQPYMGYVDASFDGRPVRICRTGYTGEHGYELIPAWDDTVGLWDALIDVIRELGGMPAGLGARDTLRTEMGYPLHGQDLSLSISPVQARSGWAVGWSKPAFWGRDALSAERAAGAGPAAVGPGRARPRHSARPHERRSNADGARRSARSPAARSRRRSSTGSAWRCCSAGTAEGDELVVDVRGRAVRGAGGQAAVRRVTRPLTGAAGSRRGRAARPAGRRCRRSR